MNIPLGRVFGTEIRAHWSWVPILAFITVVFSVELTAGGGSDWPDALAWAASIALAVVVFVSVTAHELAHVAVARRNGMDGPVVVVQLLGGTFVMEVRPRTAGQEFRTALAGPAFSFFATAVFTTLATVLASWPTAIDSAPPGVQAIQFVCLMAAVFNGFLLIVNLLPGYPMDGARIVHSLAWRRTGLEMAADVAAMRVGRYVGFALLGAGVLIVALSTDLFAGLGVMVAGWLVVGSSRLLERRRLLQSLLEEMHASEAVEADPARVPPQLTLDVFAAEYLAERLGTAAFVERGDELVGLIGTVQIRRIPRRSWNNTRTEQAMVPISAVPRVDPETDLWTAMDLLERSGLDALLMPSAEGEPSLLTRRAAARLVHAIAEEHRREMMLSGQAKRGRFRGL